jgi:hypothetical protein
MLFVSITLCHTCLFEFIRVEGGVKFMKLFKGCARYKGLGTPCVMTLSRAGHRHVNAPGQANNLSPLQTEII